MELKKKVPEVRFKGFSGEWEELKLNQVSEIIGGGTPSTIIPEFWDGDIDWYSPTEIGDKVYAEGSVKKITALGLENSSAKILPANKTVLFTSRAGIGDMAILRKDGATNQGFQSFVIKEDNDPYFVYSKGHLIKDYALKHASGSTFLEVSGKQLGNMNFYIPVALEQSRIGTWFQHLDQLITLHQKKYNKLTNIKKAMLEKMFPKNGADVPEIRFEGFEGKWSVKTFGESFTSIPNNSLSRAELNYSSGIAKNIHYGDVLIKYGELLDVCKEAVPFITDDSISKKHLPFKLQEGDVIIADAAEDESVGKCTELVNVDNEIVVSGLHTICVRPLLCFSSKYLGYFLNSPAYHNQLLSLMQGTKVLSISKTTIKGTSILFPVNLEEQQKIGTYFQKLDQLITLEQTQIEKLQNIKKACLEKMFV